MQEDMVAKQAELEEKEYTVSVGGGAVSVTINGKKEILKLTIDPDIVDPDDVETLEDIITAGCNEAIKLVESTSASEMEKITGAMGQLPGMGGLF